MKRLALFFVLIAFATTGCGTSTGTSDDESNVNAVTLTLNNGVSVECVIYDGSSYGGGIWCTPSEGGFE